MARLCLSSTTLKIVSAKNGTFRFTGWPRSVAYAHEIIDAMRPSQVIVRTFNSLCVKSIKENLSDVSLTSNAITGDSFYYVPIIRGEEGPTILSGYEVNKYIHSQVSRPVWRQGLMRNFRSFDPSTYMVIFLLFLFLMSIKYLADHFFRSRIRKWPKSRFRRVQLLKLRRKSHLRVVIFVSYLFFFFVATPFLHLFSTSQVITNKPNIITNYESLMGSNITILSGMTNNVDEYLMPTAKSVQNNDLTSRFYTYYKRKKIETKVYRANYFKSHNSSNFMTYYYKVTKELVDKKYVIMTHSLTANLYRGRLCALSSENEFYRLFVSADPSQRKILVGQPFRVGYQDSKLVRKMRIMNEFDSIQGGHASGIKELTHNLDRNFFISGRHRQIQKDYCLDERIEAHRKEDTFASDLDFFKLFWTILASILAADIYILVYENIKFLRR